MALARPLILLCLVTLTLALSGCASKASDASSRSPTQGPDSPRKAGITTKTVPAATFFYREYDLPASAVQERIKPIAEEVALAAVRRARLDIVGPLTLIFPDFRDNGDAELVVAFGYPVRGHGNRLQNYRKERKERFHCLSVVFDRKGQEASAVWRKLYETAARRGLEPIDENRVVIREQGNGYRTEFQLGVRSLETR